MTHRGLALAAVVVLASCGEPEPPLVVFAAASLSDVAQDLVAAYEGETGRRAVVSPGPSSLLARQVEAGAPADVVLLAGPDWPRWLEDRNAIEPSHTVASSRLVVIGPASAAPWSGTEPLAGLDRLALADPAHVPAGRYAEAALRAAGLWKRVESRVVPVADVRTAARAVSRGAADAALVYAPDAEAVAGVRVVLAWPDSLSQPVVFQGARVRSSTHPGASAFLDLARRHTDLWEARGFGQ